MRSPSPLPAQYTYVLPPATNKDPKVNFLINLSYIEIADIIQSYKEGCCPVIHIVESAPAPPYDPFNQYFSVPHLFHYIPLESTRIYLYVDFFHFYLLYSEYIPDHSRSFQLILV